MFPEEGCGPFFVDVYTGIIEHKHGFNHYVAFTKEELFKSVVEFCEEYKDEAGKPEEYEKASTPTEKIVAYFEGHDREFFTWDVHTNQKVMI